MVQRQNLDPNKDRIPGRRPESAEQMPRADAPIHPLLTLQHQIGNAQVARMLAQRVGPEEEEPLQAKHVDRQSAQRAEEDEPLQAKHVNRQLAQRDDTSDHEDDVHAMHVDRQFAQRAEEEELLQAKHIDRQLAQRDGDSPVLGAEGGEVDSVIADRIRSDRGNGSPLDDGTRSSMESGFGARFDQVRVHTDSAANSLNRQLSAKAFTTGSDIFFSSGAYQPETSDGRTLLSHELTHVVQQRSMSSDGPMTVSPAGDAHEQEADSMAAKVVGQQSTAQRQAKED